MRSDRKPDIPNFDSGREQISNRCLLYLLAEMDEEQTEAFETELSESLPLQTELISQSNILLGLSNVQTSTVVAPATSSSSSWRILVTTAAIAACLMIAFLIRPNDQAGEKTIMVDSTPESVLIAHAWAEGSWSATSISDLLNHGEPDTDPMPQDSFAGKEQGSDDDYSLSWIVSAVEAGAISDG